MTTKSKYETFEMRLVHRSLLKNAPYNPRLISAKAKAKLKSNLKARGLVQPLIWNERTGNLVGGHQRLACLDALEGTQDYSLTVAVVQLDDKAEREQNIFLNNGSAGGEFDFEKLDELFRVDQIDVDNTGFDPAMLIAMLGTVPGEEAAKSTEELERIAENVQTIKDIRNDRDKVGKSGDPYPDDLDYYWVLVGGSNRQRLAIEAALGLESSRYQDIRILARLLGLLESVGVDKMTVLTWLSGEKDDHECIIAAGLLH